ncbi:MAG: hypothetical protein U0270_07905 [Labilithrix sp.]
MGCDARRRSRARGASTVEYALILVAVVLIAAGSWKLLGGRLGTRSKSAGNVVADDGAGNGGKGGGDKAAGGGGAKGGGDRASATSKMTVGGSDQSGGRTPGSNRDTSTDSNAVASVNNKDSGGNADVTESFTPKRWMGVGLLVAGLIAIGYVVASMRRTKKAADAMGGKDGPPRRRRSKS